MLECCWGVVGLDHPERFQGLLDRRQGCRHDFGINHCFHAQHLVVVTTRRRRKAQTVQIFHGRRVARHQRLLNFAIVQTHLTVLFVLRLDRVEQVFGKDLQYFELTMMKERTARDVYILAD